MRIQWVKCLLAAFVGFQLLSACERADRVNEVPSSTVDDPEESVYTEMGLAKYHPSITISFVRETGAGLTDLLGALPGETLENNRWSTLYQQELGIHITYDWTAKGELYHQKLGVAIASGNIPDVVRVNAHQLRQLTNAGLIQDLSDVYDRFATPLTKEILGQEGTGPFEAATIDGKLMGIPETSSSIERAQYLWIRTDWLNTLGLQPPKTMDELLAISKAFTEQDPDRNGEHDTFGLGLTQLLWDPVMGIDGFMAGFNAFPNIWIERTEGELVYGGIQPEVKLALSALQSMYESGQIDPEFGFKNGDKVKAQIASGKIGMMYGEQWSSFVAQASYMNDSNADWQPFPIVSKYTRTPKVPLKFSNSFLVVRRDYPHPEALLKMINLHLEKNWGVTAEYDRYYSTPYPAWQLSPVTPFPPKKNLEAFRQLEEARHSGDYSMIKPEALAIARNITNYESKNEVSGWGWARTYGPAGAFAILEQYEKNNQLLYERFVGAPTETLIDKKKILEDLKMETYMNIILGGSIDEFDRFVKEWHRMGGKEITEEVNDWYGRRGREQRQE